MGRHEINRARSKQDGIIFYSTQIPVFGVYAKLNPDDSIEAYNVVTPIEEVLDILGGCQTIGYVVSRKTTILIDFILIILAVVSLKPYLIAGALYFSFFASRDFYQVISYFFEMKFGRLKSLGRFHGAEHMAINAYNHLGRIPSVEEVFRFSRFSKNCGSRRLLEKAFYYTIISIELSIAWLLPSWGYFLLLGATVAAFTLLLNKNTWLFLQALVTNKPSEKEVQVAIRGLRALEELEDSIESDYACDIFIACVD